MLTTRRHAGEGVPGQSTHPLALPWRSDSIVGDLLEKGLYYMRFASGMRIVSRARIYSTWCYVPCVCRFSHLLIDAPFEAVRVSDSVRNGFSLLRLFAMRSRVWVRVPGGGREQDGAADPRRHHRLQDWHRQGTCTLSRLMSRIGNALSWCVGS